jgi:hypothetical protein
MVSWKVDSAPNSGRNCLGRFSREAGHSRVPAPPHMIRGMIGANFTPAACVRRCHAPPRASILLGCWNFHKKEALSIGVIPETTQRCCVGTFDELIGKRSDCVCQNAFSVMKMGCLIRQGTHIGFVSQNDQISSPAFSLPNVPLQGPILEVPCDKRRTTNIGADSCSDPRSRANENQFPASRELSREFS